MPPSQAERTARLGWTKATLWMGATTATLLRIAARHRFRIHPAAMPEFVFDVGFGLFNAAMGTTGRILFGRKLARQTLPDDPIFILGHWRTGTTMLHELLALDARHRAPTTYECFSPHHFLLTERWLKRCVRWLLPQQRGFDEMPHDWDLPQEDEFALCCLGIPSPYAHVAFCNEPPEFDRYLELDQLSDEQRRRWCEGLQRWYKMLLLHRPGRLVLKSPQHTLRLPTLVELFPNARFIYLVRNPQAVIPSTMRLWTWLWQVHGYQRPRLDGLERETIEMFVRMHRRMEATRSLVDPQRLHTLRYEDLVGDPLGQLRRLYERLELGPFEPAAPTARAYLQQRANYQPNRHEVSNELRATIVQRCAEYDAAHGPWPKCGHAEPGDACEDE